MIIFFFMQVMIHPKNHSIYTMDDFYRLPPDSVDILLFGSSRMVFGLDANILSEETGFNVVGIGINGQRLSYTYEYMKEALKTQLPQVMVVDAYHFASDSQEMPIVDLHYSVDSLRWSLQKILSIRQWVPGGYRGELYCPMLRYHTRWKELKREDFVYFMPGRYRGNRGFKGLESVDPVQAPVWYWNSARELEEDAERLIDKIIHLSEEYGFKLILINFPSANITDESIARYNSLYRKIDGKGIRWLDYNITPCKEINWETDFADVAHLNKNGAVKISRDFAEYLEGCLSHY